MWRAVFETQTLERAVVAKPLPAYTKRSRGVFEIQKDFLFPPKDKCSPVTSSEVDVQSGEKGEQSHELWEQWTRELSQVE